jgi:hypothetical protein
LEGSAIAEYQKARTLTDDPLLGIPASKRLLQSSQAPSITSPRRRIVAKKARV